MSTLVCMHVLDWQCSAFSEKYSLHFWWLQTALMPRGQQLSEAPRDSNAPGLRLVLGNPGIWLPLYHCLFCVPQTLAKVLNIPKMTVKISLPRWLVSYKGKMVIYNGGTSRNRFNYMIKLGITNKGRSWCHVPPDVMRWEGHRVIRVVFLPTMCDLLMRIHNHTHPETVS